MTATSPRRGEIRPISDLPASANAAWVEVQDVDGTARKIASSAFGASIFPDSPSTYGTPTADDEEWNGTTAAWTVETAPTAPNVYSANATFWPSRLAINALNPLGGDVVSLYKAITLPTAADIAVTFDAAGVFDADFKSVEVGFRTSGAAGSAAMSAILGHATNAKLIRRKYSNIGTSTFVDQATTTIGTVAETFNLPHRYYLHLQRVSNGWELFYSIDGTSWCRVGAATTDSFTTAFAWIRMGGFSQNVPRYRLTNDWIRFNRFFL